MSRLEAAGGKYRLQNRGTLAIGVEPHLLDPPIVRIERDVAALVGLVVNVDSRNRFPDDGRQHVVEAAGFEDTP